MVTSLTIVVVADLTSVYLIYPSPSYANTCIEHVDSMA